MKGAVREIRWSQEAQRFDRKQPPCRGFSDIADHKRPSRFRLRCGSFLATSLSLLLVAFLGCAREEARGKGKTDRAFLADVLGPPPAQPTEIHADVYLDATKSMVGFLNASGSCYRIFLDDLESALISGWKTVDTRFFKFGSTIARLGDRSYLEAKEPAFYSDMEVASKTMIERLISQADSTRVTIIVSDLFQNQGDVNAVVAQVKEKCLKPKLSLLLVPIRCPFAGTVFDALVPPFQYTSGAQPGTWRTFYMMVFAPSQIMDRIAEILSNRPYIRADQRLLISPYVLSASRVSLWKNKDAKGLNMNDSTSLVLKKDGEALLDLRIPLQFRAAVPPIRSWNLEVQSTRFPGGEVDINNSVTLSNLQIAAGRLTARCHILVPESKGVYRYEVLLRTASQGAFSVPDWVDSLSSPNPCPGSQPERTLNLHPLVEGLINSHNVVNQPALAKFAVTVRRNQ